MIFGNERVKKNIYREWSSCPLFYRRYGKLVVISTSTRSKYPGRRGGLVQARAEMATQRRSSLFMEVLGTPLAASLTGKVLRPPSFPLMALIASKTKRGHYWPQTFVIADPCSSNNRLVVVSTWPGLGLEPWKALLTTTLSQASFESPGPSYWWSPVPCGPSPRAV